MKKYIVLPSFLWFAISMIAQTPLSLSDAIQIGLENNYQIKIDETDIDIAQNNNTWANAGKVPTVNFSLVNSNAYSNVNNPVSFIPQINSVRTGFVPRITLDWVLFDGYRVRATKQQLETLERQSQVDLKLTIEEAIRSIILAYYAALLQKDQLEVIGEVLDLSRDRIEYQEVRKEFGQAVTFDVLQTTDAYLNDSTNYLVQVNNYENAIRTLKNAMGVDDPAVSYTLTEEFLIPAENYQLVDLQARMLENNNSLQTLNINRELAAINTKLVESTKSPTLTLQTGPSYDWNLSSGSGTTNTGENLSFDAIASRTFSYGLTFNFTYNLFDGGVRKRNIQNAALNEVNVQYGIDNLKRNLSTQLSNTLATFNNQKELIFLTEELLENAKRNLEIAEERFRGGLITSFDYRTIQLNYINASQSRLSAIFNLKNTETELIRLIGGLVR